jgi:hypothetical protein
LVQVGNPSLGPTTKKKRDWLTNECDGVKTRRGHRLTLNTRFCQWPRPFGLAGLLGPSSTFCFVSNEKTTKNMESKWSLIFSYGRFLSFIIYYYSFYFFNDARNELQQG